MRLTLQTTCFSIALITAIVFAAGAAPPVPPHEVFDPATYCAPQPVESETAIDKPLPAYPPGALDEWSEGYALFMVTIAEDGGVRDLVTLDYVGPTAFRDSAARTVLKWRYRQHFRNGKPVPVYGAAIEVLFRLEDAEAAATHERFIRLYNQARTKIVDKKYDEAIALLDRAQHDQLNHFEQALAAFALALVANEKGDWRLALFNIRHATIKDAMFLDKETARIALRLRVYLEAQDGQLDAAACASQTLRKVDVASPASAELGDFVAKVVAALNNPEPLVEPGLVYADAARSLSPAWQHTLMRPKFAFSGMAGGVKSFRLVCTQTLLEEMVNDETQWTVPADAGPCRLFVFGDPGATFKLVEEW